MFCLAFAIRLVHLWYLRRSPFSSVLLGDASTYDSWAQAIAAGDWLGKDVFYQAPLYPYLLGGLYRAVGHDLMTVRLVQAALGSLGCVLLTLAGASLFGGGAGLAAGTLLAIFPVAVYFDALVQKSVLDAVLVSLLLAVIAGIARRPTITRCLAAGGVLGCLAVTRENTLLFLPLLAGWVYLRSARRFVPALAVTVGMAVILAPVSARNFVIGGGLHLTTSQFGPNLYIGNNDKATGTYEPIRGGHGSSADERSDAVELAEAAVGRSLSAAEVSRYWVGQAMSWVSTHPLRALGLWGRKLVLLWNVTEASDTEDIYTHAEWSPVLAIGLRGLNFGLLAPLGVLGAWLWRARWRSSWVLVALPGVYALSVSFFYVLDRYRYPLVPFLALFAGAALVELPAWWKRSVTAERVLTIAGVGLLAALCHWPLLSKISMHAATEYNLGSTLQEQGRYDEAMAHYTLALTLLPDLPLAHSNVGMLLAMRGRTDEAMWHYRRALDGNPEVGNIHANMGILLASTGRLDEGLVHLRRAVELEPRNPVFRYNLGNALTNVHIDEAIDAFREAIRLDPDYADAHNNLGILLGSSGRLDEAIEHLQTVCALRPGDSQAAANLARARSIQRAATAAADPKRLRPGSSPPNPAR